MTRLINVNFYVDKVPNISNNVQNPEISKFTQGEDALNLVYQSRKYQMVHLRKKKEKSPDVIKHNLIKAAVS